MQKSDVENLESVTQISTSIDEEESRKERPVLNGDLWLESRRGILNQRFYIQSSTHKSLTVSPIFIRKYDTYSHTDN